MSTVRGRGRHLEIEVDRALGAAAEELRGQFSERAAFYRGSRAVLHLGPLAPSADELAAFRDELAHFGVTLDGVAGEDAVAAVATGLGLAYVGNVPVVDVSPLPRLARTARSTTRTVALSDDARSLVADFAGARADLVRRRERRDAAATAAVATASVAIPPPPAGAPSGVSTLYHRGTLRGGQTLHNLGHLVVVGDVNPGAELIASGDIVVMGALRGVAHAGAQGDRGARVVALDLQPTQLRIATLIAADGGRSAGPEVAYVEGDRIALAPLGSTLPLAVPEAAR